MTRSPWSRRIDRAEKLATLHPPVAEMLNFYIEIACFQRDFYPELEQVVGSTANPSANPSQLPALEPKFKAFLSTVERHAPTRLSETAHQLRSSEKAPRSQLLDAVWVRTDVSPSQPEEFLALAFLQPYAELLRARAQPEFERIHARSLPVLQPQARGRHPTSARRRRTPFPALLILHDGMGVSPRRLRCLRRRK
jgi:hypothetical protein